MTEPTAETRRARQAGPQQSLRDTVLSVAALAAVAAVLVWSVLFIDLVRKRGDAATAPAPPSTGQLTTPNAGQPEQTPAPVTTRTS